MARYLPAEITAALDLGTLELTKDSFIDEALRLQYSDLLYRVQTREGGPAYLYVLLEHKSYPDEWVGLQLLTYMVRIWQQAKQEQAQPPLPPVLPLVLYHGEQGWNAATAFSALIDAPEALAAFMPQFRYQLCDLTRDQLDGLQSQAALAVALQVLKYSRNQELAQRLPEILALFRQMLGRRDEALGYLEAVLRYLAQASGQLDEHDLREALTRALPDDIGDSVMPTLAETWVEQGRQEGLQKGGLQSLRRTLRRQLTRRFGPLPEAVNQRIDQADIATLEAWLDQVLDALSLQTMFNSP